MSVLTPIIATAALLLSLFNTWNRWRDDQTSQWWDRITWALEKIESENLLLRQSAWATVTLLVENPPKRQHDSVGALLSVLRAELDSIANGDDDGIR